MFDLPPAVLATCWSELPDSLRVTSPRSPWKSRRFPSTLTSFLEGPAFDRAGTLHVVDIAHGRVLRVHNDGRFEVILDYDGEPNGLAFHSNGTLYIADFRNGILCFDPSTSELRTVLDRINGEPLKGPNDLTFALNGDLYFTDQGMTGLSDPTGRLVRICADGRVDILLYNVPSPNGLVINRAQTVLFLAVTRANAVWRVPLPTEGRPSKVGIAIQLTGGNGPDGLAMDDDDNLYVAHNKSGFVFGFTRWGLPMSRIRSCRGADITNVAFSGPDNRTLFMTESETGAILCAETPSPGTKLFSHV